MAQNEVVKTKNKYRFYQISSFVGEIISILAPYVAMGVVNFDTWFQTSEGWKVGLGGAMAIALSGIAVALVGANKEDKKITSGYVSLILWWFAIAFTLFLLASIIEQIAMIMFFGGLGLMGAFGLDMVSKNYKNKADEIVSIIKEVKRDDTKERYRQSIRAKLEQETVKIKIKK